MERRIFYDFSRNLQGCKPGIKFLLGAGELFSAVFEIYKIAFLCTAPKTEKWYKSFAKLRKPEVLFYHVVDFGT